MNAFSTGLDARVTALQAAATAMLTAVGSAHAPAYATATASTGPVTEARPLDVAHWMAVPDDALAAMRGGLDLGPLATSFAIERIVRVNGEIVSRTQLVLSEINRLRAGGVPDAAIAGSLATLVQIGQQGADNARALADQAAGHASGVADAAVAAGTGDIAALLPGAHGTGGGADSGGARADGVRTESRTDGSIASIAPGLFNAVSAANGEFPSRGDGGAVSSGGAGPGSTLPASRPGAMNGTAFTIPLGGMMGPSVLVSGLPNAALLSTAIQNAAQAARIDTETTISANLSSLSALRSAQFADSIRQQAVGSLRH